MNADHESEVRSLDQSTSVRTPAPLRPAARRILGFAAVRRLARGPPPRGASLSLGSTFHLRLPLDPPCGAALVFGAGFPPPGSPGELHSLRRAHAGRTHGACTRRQAPRRRARGLARALG